MKGTMVAGVAGLVALVAIGATGGALLVERTLAEEATRSLAAQGVDAHVTFSGLTATVSATDPDQLPTAMKLVLDVPHCPPHPRHKHRSPRRPLRALLPAPAPPSRRPPPVRHPARPPKRCRSRW